MSTRRNPERITEALMAVALVAAAVGDNATKAGYTMKGDRQDQGFRFAIA
jgi:hypothetical protein